MNIQNLKKARENSRYTQPQVAQKLGITTVAYQNYEYGKREPSNDLLCKISDLFGVTTDYLLGRDVDKDEPLDDLERQFNMSALEKKIVEEYLKLPKDIRGDLMEFLQKSVREVMNEKNE